jgi:hypothetical protein
MAGRGPPQVTAPACRPPSANSSVFVPTFERSSRQSIGVFEARGCQDTPQSLLAVSIDVLELRCGRLSEFSSTPPRARFEGAPPALSSLWRGGLGRLVAGFIEELALVATFDGNARGIECVMPVKEGVVIEADRQVLAAVFRAEMSTSCPARSSSAAWIELGWALVSPSAAGASKRTTRDPTSNERRGALTR